MQRKQSVVADIAVRTEKGSRDKQEDRYAIKDYTQEYGCFFFGVYDGHSNDLIASHAAAQLHKNIMESEEFRQGNIKQAIQKGFYHEDEQTLNEICKPKHDLRGGSTAAIAILMNETGELWVANSGDSRVVLAEKRLPNKENFLYEAIRLSRDHKPTDSSEKARILESGGTVSRGRVEGTINMSRALGDHHYKYPFNQKCNPEATGDFITVKPYINHIIIDPEVHDFMIVASDGLFHTATDDAVINKMGVLWHKGYSADELCEHVVDSLASDEYSDNTTCIVVLFKSSPTSSS